MTPASFRPIGGFSTSFRPETLASNTLSATEQKTYDAMKFKIQQMVLQERPTPEGPLKWAIYVPSEFKGKVRALFEERLEKRGFTCKVRDSQASYYSSKFSQDAILDVEIPTETLLPEEENPEYWKNDVWDPGFKASVILVKTQIAITNDFFAAARAIQSQMESNAGYKEYSLTINTKYREDSLKFVITELIKTGFPSAFKSESYQTEQMGPSAHHRYLHIKNPKGTIEGSIPISI